jgi:hypothetical protein
VVVVMTVHKLSAGHGYTYLTRQVQGLVVTSAETLGAPRNADITPVCCMNGWQVR